MNPKAKPKGKIAVKQQPSAAVKPVTDRWYYLFILAFAFVLYGNTIPNRYSIDDNYITGLNPMVQQGIKAIPGIFTSSYIVINAEEGGQHKFGYRPVAKATYAIEWQIFGDNPSISHFINLLLYAVIGGLLFQLLRKLLKIHHVLFPFLTVILFMAHPLHTEVVASLKNREELLSFIGGLLALKYFLKYHETGKKLNILWGAFAFVLGLLSKANIVTFLAIIPLVFYFFTDVRPRKIIVVTTVMLVIIAAAAILPRIFLGQPERQMQFIENPLLFGVSFPERIGTGMMTLLFYLKMMIFPHPLVFYYGYNMLPVVGLGNPWVWVSIVVHLGLLGFALYKIREKHILSFAILFYLINISMFSNLLAFPTGIVAERFLNIALLGFCLAVVYGIYRITGTRTFQRPIPRKALNYIILLFAILVIPATAKTIIRNKDWKTELSLFAADAPYLKNSAKGNFIYATNLRSKVVEQLKSGVPGQALEKDAQTCITHFKRATAVYPNYADAWNNLGEVYLLITNQPDSAIYNFEQAVRINPKFTAAFYNLGYTYQVTNQPEKAIPNYEKALELLPYEIRAMSNLAKLYQETGRKDDAIRLNEDIMLIEPGLDLPYINLGTYAMRDGQAAKALDYFEKAIGLNPNNFELNMRLQSYFTKVGDSAKADHYLELARRSGKPQ